MGPDAAIHDIFRRVPGSFAMVGLICAGTSSYCARTCTTACQGAPSLERIQALTLKYLSRWTSRRPQSAPWWCSFVICPKPGVSRQNNCKHRAQRRIWSQDMVQLLHIPRRAA